MIQHMYLFKDIKEFFSTKKLIIRENTFLIWEPCSSSHAEVVPGFTKYLLDLGYHISILITPQRYKEGLFCRFDSNENISYNIMTQKQIRKFFKKDHLDNIKGVLVTTVGKLYDGIDFSKVYNSFHKNVDQSKLFFVEHEIDKSVDNNALDSSIITLRKMDYKNAKTIPINPHYFGEIKISPKNNITNFITIGALSEKRKSTKVIINAIEKLIAQGVNNFKITVIGKGKISDLPNKLQPYIDIKGRLNFTKMYEEIEKADFILSAYEDIEAHLKYATSKTSGTYQLVYGFLKPIFIKTNHAPINGFDPTNSIIYDTDEDYSNAMLEAINIDSKKYLEKQNNLKQCADSLYLKSKQNFEHLINSRKE
ncbi:MAG: glycosyltransferase involved in cell wall biosynthesis [Francisella sp.]